MMTPPRDLVPFVFLPCHALAIAVLAGVLRPFLPRGLPWWARLPLVGASLAAGYLVQHLTGWLGLPPLRHLLLFPLLSHTLMEKYVDAFEGNDMDRGMAAYESLVWTNLHTALAWLLIGTLVWLWFHLGPRAMILYGDSPLPKTSSPSVEDPAYKTRLTD